MKVETITTQGSSSFTTNHTIYLDVTVGENKRSLRIESDGRLIDETDSENEQEI